MLADGHDVYLRHTLYSESLKTKTDSRMCVEVLKNALFFDASILNCKALFPIKTIPVSKISMRVLSNCIGEF